MHKDFVPCIQGVHVLCKPWLILSFINGPIVTPSCQYNHNDLSVARGGHVNGVPQSVILTLFIVDHLYMEERLRVCLSSALYTSQDMTNTV